MTTSVFEIFTTVQSEYMEGLLAECLPGNNINSDPNLLKIKELSHHTLIEFRKEWEKVSDILTRENPDFMKSVTVNMRKQEMVRNTERAIEEREVKLAELKRKVNGLRKSVPDMLIDNI